MAAVPIAAAPSATRVGAGGTAADGDGDAGTGAIAGSAAEGRGERCSHAPCACRREAAPLPPASPGARPVTALVVVDVQHDFIDGSLALRGCPAGEDGAAVVPTINELRRRCGFDVVVLSLDWHPPDHCSFAENAALHGGEAGAGPGATITLRNGTQQQLWPRHCVQHTAGAQLHPELLTEASDHLVFKGTHPGTDSYSAFFDNCKERATALEGILAAGGVEEVFVCGLALDVCVKATALHAAELGFRTTVVRDACRGVDSTGIAEAEAALAAAGVRIAQAEEVVRERI